MINKEVVRILDMPEVRERLVGVDFNILTSTPEEYDKSRCADIATLMRVAQEAGLRSR